MADFRRHPLFAGEPVFGKLAVGGEWERAVVFTPGEIVAFDGDEVACEAFFADAFFGVRGAGAQFVAAFSLAMASGHFFDALPVPDGAFSFAELGAEGAWQTVGPVRVDPWRALRDFDRFWGRVKGLPVAKSSAALEFTYEGGGGQFWFALPVAVDGRLDAGLLRDALVFFGDEAPARSGPGPHPID